MEGNKTSGLEGIRCGRTDCPAPCLAGFGGIPRPSKHIWTSRRPQAQACATYAHCPSHRHGEQHNDCSARVAQRLASAAIWLCESGSQSSTCSATDAKKRRSSVLCRSQAGSKMRNCRKARVVQQAEQADGEGVTRHKRTYRLSTAVHSPQVHPWRVRRHHSHARRPRLLLHQIQRWPTSRAMAWF